MSSALGVSLSSGAIGLMLLVLAIWVLIRKVKGGGGGGGLAGRASGGGGGGGNRWLKAAVWLMLGSGLFLGMVSSRILSLIVTGGKNTAAVFAGKMFGVTAGVIMLVLGIIIVLELWLAIGPKAKTRKWHPYMALFAFPVFFASSGVLANFAQQAGHTVTVWMG